MADGLQSGGYPVDAKSFVDWLEPSELTQLRSLAVSRRFAKGTTLFHQDDEPGRLLVLTEGRVKVSVLSREGREVVLGFRGPGDLLGELSAIDGLPRSATVTTLEPTEAMAIAPRDFESFLESNPRIALLLLRLLAARLREADRERAELAAYDTVRRVAHRLLNLAERFGQPATEGVTIALPISQEELAGWIGASREAVAKALHTLRTLGCVETHRREITITNLDRLRGLTD